MIAVHRGLLAAVAFAALTLVGVGRPAWAIPEVNTADINQYRSFIA
jgi:hypothetical protein